MKVLERPKPKPKTAKRTPLELPDFESMTPEQEAQYFATLDPERVGTRDRAAPKRWQKELKRRG
jgi:hypothetical protein